MAEGADEEDTSTEEADRADDTVPRVDLEVYQLSVSVRGRSDDDLADVEEAARQLIDHLIDQSERLEERRDDRGVS